MRSVWNGSISFGLVSIPIKLYSGSEERRIDLDMLDRRDNSRIRYKRVNENTGKEVEWDDIVKGYKQDDNYIVLEDDDFDMADMKKSKTIDIEEFVEEKAKGKKTKLKKIESTPTEATDLMAELKASLEQKK